MPKAMYNSLLYRADCVQKTKTCTHSSTLVAGKGRGSRVYDTQ